MGQSLNCTESSELTQFAGQAKVNNFDLCPGGVDTDDVLRLEVQMDDVLLVHVLHALQDLLHVASAGGLRVLKVLVDQAFEELAACNTGTKMRLCSALVGTLGEVFLSPTQPEKKKYGSKTLLGFFQTQRLSIPSNSTTCWPLLQLDHSCLLPHFATQTLQSETSTTSDGCVDNDRSKCCHKQSMFP